MRIWVARPEPGATRTGHRLSALGHAPLVAPVLTIRRTGATLPAGAFAGLLLTSANAVAALTTADQARFERIPAFAVGARTATLARRAGLSAVSEAGGDAAHLIVLVRAALPIGSPLLHVTGREGKAEPAASLRAAGYPISSVIAYTAVAETVLPPAVAEALGAYPGSLEAVLHYSRRSAETAYGLACTAELDGAFGALKHYCLSGDVAAPLVAAGLDVHFVAERPDEATLLAGLATGT